MRSSGIHKNQCAVKNAKCTAHKSTSLPKNALKVLHAAFGIQSSFTAGAFASTLPSADLVFFFVVQDAVMRSPLEERRCVRPHKEV
jgi:hypothetical protein